MKTKNNEQACALPRCEITRADLPLCCPPQSDRIWDAHPRVYLPIEEQGVAICPYCDTEYVLVDSPSGK